MRHCQNNLQMHQLVQSDKLLFCNLSQWCTVGPRTHCCYFKGNKRPILDRSMKIINLRSRSHCSWINELKDQITKPSPEQVLNYGSSDIHLKAISTSHQSLEFALKLTYLKLHKIISELHGNAMVAKTQIVWGWLCCLIWFVYILNQRWPILFTHICTSLPRKFEHHCCLSPVIQGHSVTENPHIIGMWGRPRLEAFVVGTVASFTIKPIGHNNNTGSTASIGMSNCVHNTLIITSNPVCHSWKWRNAIFINCPQVCWSTQ